MTEPQMKDRFIRGLSPMNQYNVCMMGKLSETRTNLTKLLAESEQYMLAEQENLTPISGKYITLTPNPFSGQQRYYTESEIEKLVEE